MAKIYNLIEPIFILSGKIYIKTRLSYIIILITVVFFSFFFLECVLSGEKCKCLQLSFELYIHTYVVFFRLILNCDIENIDVRTIDPFNAPILSDYKVTNVIKILNENVFHDISKYMK